MTASLKHDHGRKIRGMRQLESKISSLQNQYQQLINQRQQDIAALIATLNLASVEDSLLVGGLMFIKDKVTTQDPILEGWHHIGEQFLRKQKSKEHLPSQKFAVPLTTDQPLKKHPQSREKKDEATAIL